MEIRAKYFDALTTRELFEILRARSAVFVVEQNCVYQDMDDRDYESLHIFFEEDEKVTAYLRVFQKDADTVQIGRVLTVKRGTGLGGKLLSEGIRQAIDAYHPRRLVLEAQCYAAGFYAREGFRISSEPFMEDGIPHVWMTREL